MDLLAVDGVEGYALLRASDGDGDLAARVHPGVGKGDALADGRGLQVLAVDDPGQGELLVGDELLLDQDVEELLDGLDLVLGLEVEDDLGGFQKIRKMRAFMRDPCSPFRSDSNTNTINLPSPEDGFFLRKELSGLNWGGSGRPLELRTISWAQRTIWRVPR